MNQKSTKLTRGLLTLVVGAMLICLGAFGTQAQTTAAPTQISFTILNTSCGGSATYEFFLNGTSIGTVNGDPNQSCTCDPSPQTFTVNNAALLAGAWDPSGSNTLKFTKSYGQPYFSWVSAKLDFTTGSTRAYYDYGGGDATEASLCDAGYTDAAFNELLTPGPSVFYKDVDGDGYGDPGNTIQEANNSLSPTTNTPPAGYVTRAGDCDDANPTIPSQSPCLAKPFNKTASEFGFTQELVASVPNTSSTSGYGFDKHGNIYTNSLNDQKLYKIDLSTTIPGPGGIGTVHPITDLGKLTYRTGSRTGQTTYGGNFTQYPDGTVYLNTWTGLGVVQVDLETASITSDPIPGAPNGSWGIGVDPQLNSAGHHNIWYQANGGIAVIDPVDHRYIGTIPISCDGLTIDPTGNFLFPAQGFAVYKRVLPDPASGVPVFQQIGQNHGGSPDGMAFAVIGNDQVVISNDASAQTVTLWKFPDNDFTKVPTPTIIASQPTRSMYGDMANVGPDGYLYITYWNGTRFPDGSTNNNASVVRFGPAGRFLPPTHSDNLSLTPATDTKSVGESVVLTASLATTDLSTNQTVPVANASVTFKVVGGPDQGQTFTGNTDANGRVSFTLVNQNGAGDDVIHAQFVDSDNNTQTSNNAVITFVKPTCTTPVFASSPGDQAANTSANSCDNTVTYSSTESVTGTPAASITYAFTGATTGSGDGNGSGSVFNKGVTTVTLTATNSCGSATSTFTVTVSDNTAPVAPVLADVTGECSATATVPTATDNCSGTVTGSTTDATTYSTQGTHVITWTFNDGNGNIATATQNVVVKDVTAPVAPVLADVTGECSATATVPTTTDNCAGTITGATTDALSYSTQGTHVITWMFNDGNGNIATATQNVIVKDVTAPTVKLKNISATLVNGSVTIAASQLDNGSYDNCSDVTVTIPPTSFICGEYGPHNVLVTVTDANGLSSTATAVVTVIGNTPTPAIAVTRSNTTFTGLPNNTVALGYGAQSLTLTASNSSYGATTYKWSPAAGLSSTIVSSPVFTPTSAGTYTYTVTATNEYGCSNTATITLTVVDVRCGNKMDKVVVCHKTGSVKNPTEELCIAPSAVATHLAHGDKIGSCGSGFIYADIIGTDKVELSSIQQSNSLEAKVASLTAYPNPFGSQTTVSFTLTEDEATVSLDLFGLNGAKVQNVYSGSASAGRKQSFEFNSSNLPSGIYFFRLTGSKANLTFKVIIAN